MSSTNYLSDARKMPRFRGAAQADDHVRRWRLEQWFWDAFRLDILDIAQPPAELLP